MFVEVKKTLKKGRGVFALREFKAGEVIENCPVINITPAERKRIENTILNYFIYPWRSTKSGCLVLGYGSIYNHSYNPNADWKQDFKNNTMMYRAIKSITKGEEITVNYNGEPDDTTPLEGFDF